MKLVVGLGNPGAKYRRTRHNIGFEVAGQVARRLGATGQPRQRFSGDVLELRADGEKLVLLCPATYMNRSGESVRAAVDFFQLPLEELLVVCDDFNLPLGTLRFRARGSAGGQKGLANVIQHLGTDQFPRLRIGIGPVPERVDPADFVLHRFTAEQEPVVDAVIDRACQGVIDWIRHGTDHCMNQYNRRSSDNVNEEKKP